ncbi:MAG: AAA-like domain-containing protein [Jaaginema sp. PMC 1079.18]|nr:AAA-like domain-containing protein [Jaaginema sp. PMC 1080.18]MEC4853392.1 AAA-like domain-containing protein [Jaaginema sp. PMC 1079.18]MEC4864705.1 AAA-like domain-containing protein [Jaaginema sp. PMC 1078.18]
MAAFLPSSNIYQVGGSLPTQAVSYVERTADLDLLKHLQNREFCYVFNARQMGKSSLRVRVTHQLQQQGIRCGIIDLTAIGTQEITASQWYASIIALLVKAFHLDLNLLEWWRSREHLSLVNRLSDFVETVLLQQVSENIIIFIDEIDSVLSLKFGTDDFFALIRACYNRRTENANYQRLTFCLLGVTTPGNLISDWTRTPFNLGKAIELRGFESIYARPLAQGFYDLPFDDLTILNSVLSWTGGQPFLTQKLCQLLVQHKQQGYQYTQVTEFVERIVQRYIIESWESQDEPEHLKTIRDRLLYCEQRAGRLLGLYQKIIRYSLQQQPQGIAVDNSPEQIELVLTGLVERKNGILQVKNPIYQHIFNETWVTQQLNHLRPYSQALESWLVSGCEDKSWLLRGQALQNTLAWSADKSLSDRDYQFLAASQELDRKETQNHLESQRLQAVEARLKLEQARSREQRQNLKRQRILLSIVSIITFIAIALGLVAYRQARQTAKSELRAILLSSQALFASNKRFDALLQAIRAQERFTSLKFRDKDLATEVKATLEKTVLAVQESNRLDGHTAATLDVDYSPDGKILVSVGVDQTVKLWTTSGQLLNTLTGHDSVIRNVQFSPQGDVIASAGDDKTLRIWTKAGKLLHKLPTKLSGVWALDFSPNNSDILIGGADSPVQIWDWQKGELKQTLGNATGTRAAAFSPDGKTIGITNIDNTVTLWDLECNLQRVFRGHTTPVYAIAFHPDNDIIATGSIDGTLILWRKDGSIIKTINAHEANVKSLQFSQDGSFLASGSWDKTVKLWKLDGTLINISRGHDAAIWGIAIRPDGKEIASAGAESVIRLWQTRNPFQQTIYGVVGITRSLTFNGDGTIMATSGTEKNFQLWQLDGTLIKTIKGHDAAVTYLETSSDGQTLASSSEDHTVKLWSFDGTLLDTLPLHTATILSVAWHPQKPQLIASTTDGKVNIWDIPTRQSRTYNYSDTNVPIWQITYSPDGQKSAIASNDGTVQIWQPDGTLIHQLESHQAAVLTVAFHPDSQRLASGSGDTTVKLWREDGTLDKTLTDHNAAIWDINFSPPSLNLPGYDTIMATASIDETVKLWTAEGELLHTLKGHQSGVRAVAFHPLRPLLVSAADDQTLVVWNLEPILQLDPLTYGCNWVKNYLQYNTTVTEEEARLCD